MADNNGGRWNCGLAPIDGHPIYDHLNPTAKRPPRLENGQRYSALIRVRLKGDSVQVEGLLDGVPLTNWAGDVTSIDDTSENPKASSGQPAIESWHFPRTCHGARLRLISGKAYLLSDVAPQLGRQRGWAFVTRIGLYPAI